MSHELDPKVGRWYRCIDDDELFKVVSIDEDDDLVEIRYADGELEELDSAGWIEMDLERAEEPEDWRDPEDEEAKADEGDNIALPDEGDDARPVRRPPKPPREGWDEDDDEDDGWDEDEDDDSYDSDR